MNTPAPVCRCDPKIGGFVYNCPIHAQHVMLNGKTHFSQQDLQQLADAKANFVGMSG